MIRDRPCKVAAEKTPTKKNHLYIQSGINSFHYHSLTLLLFCFAVSSNIVKGNQRSPRDQRCWGQAGWCYTKAPLLPNLVSITPAPWAVPVGGYFYAKPPGNGEPPAEQGSPKGCREDAQVGAKILQRKEVKEPRLLSLSKG